MDESRKDKNEEGYRDGEVFSRSVRAGKRTYFFDVKSTKSNDYYLTITESKRRFNNENGKFFFEKHKLFLYKEDFEKFTSGLNESVDRIRTLKREQGEEIVEKVASEFSDVHFDDVDSQNNI